MAPSSVLGASGTGALRLAYSEDWAKVAAMRAPSVLKRVVATVADGVQFRYVRR
jgi:hypothetical protein